MKILLVLVISTVSCAQLNNNYLPPANAQASGGSGLKAPKGPNNFAGANAPIPPGRSGSPSKPSVPAQPSGPPIEIISYENVNNGDGSYKWSYESANGIKAEEIGDVKNKGSDNAIQTVQGSYSYTSPEGQLVQITYTADENGFQAQGDSLPTPVPLPIENLKALAEFEAAYATAVPESSSAGQGSQPARPGSQSPPAARPGSQGAQGPRPGAQGARPGSAPSVARPQQPGGFPTQQRPSGGSGSGNYSPQTGYSY